MLLTLTLVLAAQPAGASTLVLSEGFNGSSLNSAKWRHWWGKVRTYDNVAHLSSTVPDRSSETYSAMITSRYERKNIDFRFKMQTYRQLRENSRPNTWEVAWAMFRFSDLHHYYYFMMKPNGVELGKKHGSDAQIFLATASSPKLSLKRWNAVRIVAYRSVIDVYVDGTRVLHYRDPNPLGSGSVGLYEEDAHVHFNVVRLYAL